MYWAGANGQARWVNGQVGSRWVNGDGWQWWHIGVVAAAYDGVGGKQQGMVQLACDRALDVGDVEEREGEVVSGMCILIVGLHQCVYGVVVFIFQTECK